LSEIALANAWCADSNQRVKALLDEISDSNVTKVDQVVLNVGKMSLDANGYLAKSPIGC
jgi:Zn finger protein HypA/HybF involved in hydrogenase expression